MSKYLMPALLLCTVTVLSGSSAAAYSPPECRMALKMQQARPFVDRHLALSQLTPAEAAHYRALPNKGQQRQVFLLVRGYLRLCEQVIDGRMKAAAESADDIERVEWIGKRYLSPSERAIFHRAATLSRRAANAGPMGRCQQALIHAVDGPPLVPARPVANPP